MEVLLDKQPEKYIRKLPMKSRILAALEKLSRESPPEYAIETDLTCEEHALIAESVQRYHSDPSRFVPLKNLL
jgi:hypothetical protein